MDVITGLWALWILFLFYILLSAPSLLMKGMVLCVMALSVHDAWRYIKDLKELKERKAQELDNKEKEKSKKDHQ